MKKLVLAVAFAMVSTHALFAQMVHSTPVDIGNNEFIYSEFASTDGVTISDPSLYSFWMEGYLDLSAGSEFTVTSEFGTLTALHIITSKYDSPSSSSIKVVAVNGSDADIPEDINVQTYTTKFEGVDAVDLMINLWPATFQSITFQLTKEIGVLQFKVALLITPEFELNDGDTLYGSDRIRLIPKSNYATHFYSLDPPEGEQPNSPEYCKEYPADGIEVTDEGLHTVYAFSSANQFETSLNQLTFNYKATNPDDVGTTSITPVTADTSNQGLYDLQGRRIVTPKPGAIYIQRQGAKSQLVKK